METCKQRPIEFGENERFGIFLGQVRDHSANASLAVLPPGRRGVPSRFRLEASATSLLPPRLMPAPCAVHAVNIRPIMNRAVGARPGIDIDPSDLNGPGEVDPLLAALSHRIDNGVTIPMVVGVGIQQPSSQIVDTINPKDSRILKGLGLKR